MPDPAQAPNPTAERDDRPSPHGATISWTHADTELSSASGSSLDRGSLYPHIQATIDLATSEQSTITEGRLSIDQRMDLLKNLIIEARKPDGQFSDHNDYLAELNRVFGGLSRSEASQLKRRFNQEVYPTLNEGAGLFSGREVQNELQELVKSRTQEGTGTDRMFDNMVQVREQQFVGLILRGGVTNQEIQDWARQVQSHDPSLLDVGNIAGGVYQNLVEPGSRWAYDSFMQVLQPAWDKFQDFFVNTVLPRIASWQYGVPLPENNPAAAPSEPDSGSVSPAASQPQVQMDGLVNPTLAGTGRFPLAATALVGTGTTGFGIMDLLGGGRKLLFGGMGLGLMTAEMTYPLIMMGGASKVAQDYHRGSEARVSRTDERCLAMLLAAQNDAQKESLVSSLGIDPSAPNADQRFESWIQESLSEGLIQYYYAERAKLNSDPQVLEIMEAFQSADVTIDEIAEMIVAYGNSHTLYRSTNGEIFQAILSSDKFENAQQKADFLTRMFPLSETERQELDAAVELATGENPDYTELARVLLDRSAENMVGTKAYFEAYNLTHDPKLQENFAGIEADFGKLSLQFALQGTDYNQLLCDLVASSGFAGVDPQGLRTLIEELGQLAEINGQTLEEVLPLVQPQVSTYFTMDQQFERIANQLKQQRGATPGQLISFMDCCREARELYMNDGEVVIGEEIARIVNERGIFEESLTTQELTDLLGQTNDEIQQQIPLADTISLLSLRTYEDLAPYIDALVPYVSSQEYQGFHEQMGKIVEVLNSDKTPEIKTNEIKEILESLGSDEVGLKKFMMAQRYIRDLEAVSALTQALYDSSINPAELPDNVLNMLGIVPPPQQPASAPTVVPEFAEQDLNGQIAMLRSNFAAGEKLDTFVGLYQESHAAIENSSFTDEEKQRLHYIHSKSVESMIGRLAGKESVEIAGEFDLQISKLRGMIQSLGDNSLRVVKDPEGKITSFTSEAFLNN